MKPNWLSLETKKDFNLQIDLIDFARFSSIKIGSIQKVHIIDSKELDLSGFFIVGKANNLLISPNPTSLAMLSKRFDYCYLEGNEVRAGGAFASGRLASFFKKHNLKGAEFLSSLPGSVGGLIAMNAGMKEFDTFEILKWVDFGCGKVPANEIEHGYRFATLKGVVFEAGFKAEIGYDAAKERLCKAMRSNQPSKPSAGSCFKNPPNDYAGRLLEAVGLRGFAKNGVGFSQKHANFLVNLDGGGFDDAIWLIDEAKKRVFEQFGIDLECEIKIV